ncbi:MAG: hypothetical protein V3U27_12565, partial [Candidatus Tectomicrobia bacterium]
EHFQHGRFKLLNLSFFYSLSTPLAKRLYRWVDEHIFPRGHIEVDIRHLAHTRIEMSRSIKYPSSIMQRLEPALNELQDLGVLEWSLEPSKTESGKKLVFTRPRKPKPPPPRLPALEAPTAPEIGEEDPSDALFHELLDGLTEEERESLKQEAVEMLDSFNRHYWEQSKGKALGAEALVQDNMKSILLNGKTLSLRVLR